MAMQKLIMSGFGGQGVLLMGQIIAYAGMLEGKEVTWMPSYGPEMRGGTANCTVIVSDKKISSPVINEADAVIAMNLPSLTKFEDSIVPGGKIFINSSLIDEKAKRDDIEPYYIDANAIAMDLNNDKVANMVILGAVIEKTAIVERKSIEAVMEKLFTGSKARHLDVNKEALTAGSRAVR